MQKMLNCRCLGCGAIRSIKLTQLKGIVAAMEHTEQENALVLCIECSNAAVAEGVAADVKPLTTEDLELLGRENVTTCPPKRSN